jgi:hypothetical protein
MALVVESGRFETVLWQQVSHLLLKYTKSGYETVLTAACAVVPRSKLSNIISLRLYNIFLYEIFLYELCEITKDYRVRQSKKLLNNILPSYLSVYFINLFVLMINSVVCLCLING